MDSVGLQGSSPLPVCFVGRGKLVEQCAVHLHQGLQHVIDQSHNCPATKQRTMEWSKLKNSVPDNKRFTKRILKTSNHSYKSGMFVSSTVKLSRCHYIPAEFWFPANTQHQPKNKVGVVFAHRRNLWWFMSFANRMTGLHLSFQRDTAAYTSYFWKPKMASSCPQTRCIMSLKCWKQNSHFKDGVRQVKSVATAWHRLCWKHESSGT